MIQPALLGFILLLTVPNTDRTKPVIKKVVIEDARCHGYATGSAQVFVQGGVPPYQYSLDGKFFQKEAMFKHLKAGDYRIYLKDAEGNLNTTTFKVYQPEKIKFLPAKTSNSGCCNPNGAVLVEARGGTGVLQYQINESNFQSSGYFTGLAGGYTVVAMDPLGCKASLVVKVNDFSGPIIDFLNSTEVSCPGGENGSMEIFTVGGSGNISYSIDGGKNWQQEQRFKGLKAGQYNIKIKDETGCADSASLTISQPPVIETSVVFTQPLKNDKNLCMAEVRYSIGGTGQHQFSMDGQHYTSATVLYSSSDKITLYTRDMAGCVATTVLDCAHASLKQSKK